MKLFKFLFYCCLAISYAVSANPNLNYQHFAHLPMITGAKVSPDGKFIAAIHQSEAGPSVVVAKFGSTEIATVAKLKKDKDRIDEVLWLSPKRLLISASYSERYNKNRWRVPHFYAVNIDGTEVLSINARVDRSAPFWKQKRAKELTLVSSLPDDPEHILLQGYDLKDNAQAVYKVNVHTKAFDKSFVNQYRVVKWLADRNGNVQFGYGYKKNEPEVKQYWYRPDNHAEWKMINERRNMTGDTFAPMSIQDGKVMILSDRELNREALWEFNPKKGEFTKLVYAHPEFDLTGVVLSDDKTRVVGVNYVDHYPKTHYFAESDGKVSKAVANSLVGYNTIIASRDKSKQKMLVLAYKNNSPTKYFWFDFSNKSGGFWFSQYPYLEGQKLGATMPFSYQAKDGMQLHGYLTMPPSSIADKKPPLVVMPHGGPFGPRDDQVFNYMVQFVANMGYAVLQPNFRGSGGYGKLYQTSGYKQFGEKMQTDVYDAIDWLEQQGNVDVSNACIMGWSYGGYVALTAAYQKPKQYQCIISVAGMSDVYKVADEGTKVRSSLSEFYKGSYGDTAIKAEAEQLKQASAINYVEKIRSPILLIHGINDTQVHYGQSVDFYEKAKDAGVDVDYIEFKSGTHYLDENNNRLEAFKAIEQFLSKHLKV